MKKVKVVLLGLGAVNIGLEQLEQASKRNKKLSWLLRQKKLMSNGI